MARNVEQASSAGAQAQPRAAADAGAVLPSAASPVRTLPRTAADGDGGEEDAGAARVTDAVSSSAASELGPLAIGAPEPLAVVAGYYGSDRSSKQFYSGDLGFVVPDHERLWLFFGDSWVNPLVRKIDVAANQDADDALGYLSLAAFPDGRAVDQYLRNHPAPRTGFTWQAEAPGFTLVENPASGVATPVREVRDGKNALSSGAGLTPLFAFSNQQGGASAGLFGVFFRNAPVECQSGACNAGLTCDAGLGVCVKRGQARTDLSVPCVLGNPSTSDCEECQAVPGKGLCTDTGSSVYDPNVARGRSAAVAMTHEVGNLTRGSDHVFATQPWNTQRFFNLTGRTVRDFDAGRAAGSGNDYQPANGAAPEREGVFLWGRPHFGGIHKQGRDAELYLAWLPMPAYAEDGHFAWQPRFFAGLDDAGRPRFVEREVDSAPLDLDAATPGAQPQEPIDVVGHMTVAYLPSLQRWIMLYGGNLQTLFAGLVYGDDAPLIDASTLGPIYVRYAQQPWGPWTAPERFAEPGDPNALTGLYAEGGILRSTSCNLPKCVHSEVTLLNENGWLYAPHIVEPWLMPRERGVDIFWHVSTWNPYQIVLMKTSLMEAQ